MQLVIFQNQRFFEESYFEYSLYPLSQHKCMLPIASFCKGICIIKQNSQNYKIPCAACQFVAFEVCEQFSNVVGVKKLAD